MGMLFNVLARTRLVPRNTLANFSSNLHKIHKRQDTPGCSMPGYSWVFHARILLGVPCQDTPGCSMPGYSWMFHARILLGVPCQDTPGCSMPGYSWVFHARILLGIPCQDTPGCSMPGYSWVFHAIWFQYKIIVIS